MTNGVNKGKADRTKKRTIRTEILHLAERSALHQGTPDLHQNLQL